MTAGNSLAGILIVADSFSQLVLLVDEGIKISTIVAIAIPSVAGLIIIIIVGVILYKRYK
jgi:hypothetical protein